MLLLCIKMYVQKEDNLHFVLFSYSEKKHDLSEVLNNEAIFFLFNFDQTKPIFSLVYRATRVRQMWTDDDVRQVVTQVHMAVLVRLFQFTHLISEKNEIFCVHGNFDNILYTFISWMFVVNLTWPTTYVIIIKLYIDLLYTTTK